MSICCLMEEVDIMNDCLSSCPVCVKLDTLKDVVVALDCGEAEAILDYSEVAVGGVVKVAAYIASCPLFSALRLDFSLSNSC